MVTGEGQQRLCFGSLAFPWLFCIILMPGLLCSFLFAGQNYLAKSQSNRVWHNATKNIYEQADTPVTWGSVGHCYNCYLNHPETQRLVHFCGENCCERSKQSNPWIPDCKKSPPLAGDWLLPSDGCREPIEDCPPCHEWKGEGAGNGCMGAATGEYSSSFAMGGAKIWQNMMILMKTNIT